MCACVSGGGGGGRIREQKVTLSSNFALKRGGGGGRNNEGGVTTREYGTLYAMLEFTKSQDCITQSRNPKFVYIPILRLRKEA